MSALIAVVALVTLPAAAQASFRLGVGEGVVQAADLTDRAALVRGTSSSLFRSQVNWASAAPTRPADATDPRDPAYRWTDFDNADRLAAAAGAELLLNVDTAPAWAEGPNRPTTGYGLTGKEGPSPGAWNPDPVAFGQFAKALARRYDGSTPDPQNPSRMLPRVRLFEVWNEPELKRFLAPQCSVGLMSKSGRCTRRGKVIAADLYRSLLNAFHDGIKEIQPDAMISVGGIGSASSSSQGYEVAPFAFIRSLLCLVPGPTPGTLAPKSSAACPTKARFDALSYHPYTLFGTPTTKSPQIDGLVLGDTPKLKSTLEFAVANGTVEPATPKEMWVTEIDWLTCPPCGYVRSTGAKRGLSETAAAAYTSEMIYRLWSWGVTTMTWYSLVDRPGWWPAAGLYFQGATTSEAKPKLGLTAFAFPVFAARTTGGAFAWAMSPCRQAGDTVKFEAKAGRRWVQVASGTTADDSTVTTPAWAIPRGTTSVRASVVGGACDSRQSLPVSILPR